MLYCVYRGAMTPQNTVIYFRFTALSQNLKLNPANPQPFHFTPFLFTRGLLGSQFGELTTFHLVLCSFCITAYSSLLVSHVERSSQSFVLLTQKAID